MKDNEKATAPINNPFLAIEPPLFRLGALAQFFRDFLAPDIEKPHREIPDDMDASFGGHGLSFPDWVEVYLTNTGIGPGSGEAVDHFSAIIAYFYKMIDIRDANIRRKLSKLAELWRNCSGITGRSHE